MLSPRSVTEVGVRTLTQTEDPLAKKKFFHCISPRRISIQSAARRLGQICRERLVVIVSRYSQYHK